MMTRSSRAKEKKDGAKNKRLRSALAKVVPPSSRARGSSRRKKKCPVDVSEFLKRAENEDRAVGGTTMAISCQVPSYRRAQSAVQDRFVEDLKQYYGKFLDWLGLCTNGTVTINLPFVLSKGDRYDDLLVLVRNPFRRGGPPKL